MTENILYSPWRMQYIRSERDKKCVFCLNPKVDSDRDHLVVYRSTHCFVIMNLFPYNNGHIMVVPNRHLQCLCDLNSDELQDLFQTVQLAEKALKCAYSPEGINVGINLGKAAGAGIDQHLHIHLVPRWNGDTNFFTVISGTRTIPEDFETSYKKLKEAFAQ